jgi:hypothetical protein
MSSLQHNTEVKYIPFLLLAVKLKDYKKRLTDAVWDEDVTLARLLEYEINIIETQIALGEKYDIPF